MSGAERAATGKLVLVGHDTECVYSIRKPQGHTLVTPLGSNFSK